MVEKIFGKKLGMTQYFLDEGKMVPVTIVRTWPNIILQQNTYACLYTPNMISKDPCHMR